jgi:hypothetical protein
MTSATFCPVPRARPSHSPLPSFSPPLQDLKISSSSGAPSLDKHVAWLQDVTRQREALMAAQAEAQRKREEKRRAVAAQQQAFRDLVRANEDGCLGDTVPVGLLTPRAAAAAKEAGLLSGSSKPAGSLREAPAGPAEAGHSARAAAASVRASGAGGGSHGYSGSGSAPSRPDAAATGKENRGDATGKAAAPPAAAATAAAAAAARKKPAWARSEGAQAALEDEDADQLLQFAEGLDFDRCVAALCATLNGALLTGAGAGRRCWRQRNSSASMGCLSFLRGLSTSGPVEL